MVSSTEMSAVQRATVAVPSSVGYLDDELAPRRPPSKQHRREKVGGAALASMIHIRGRHRCVVNGVLLRASIRSRSVVVTIELACVVRLAH
jgi:hypothetical protein